MNLPAPLYLTVFTGPPICQWARTKMAAKARQERLGRRLPPIAIAKPVAIAAPPPVQRQPEIAQPSPPEPVPPAQSVVAPAAVDIDAAEPKPSSQQPEGKEPIHLYPAIETVVRMTARYYQIGTSDIKSSRRFDRVVRPRQIAMYLCRKLTTGSFPHIGRHVGDRDHSTVVHAVKTIERLMCDQWVKDMAAIMEMVASEEHRQLLVERDALRAELKRLSALREAARNLAGLTAEQRRSHDIWNARAGVVWRALGRTDPAEGADNVIAVE